MQMLPQRIARSSATGLNFLAARRLPALQRRCFLPDSYSDRKVFEAKFPERQTLTEAEDPGMVSITSRAC